MREIRQSGSEGGGGLTASPYPYVRPRAHLNRRRDPSRPKLNWSKAGSNCVTARWGGEQLYGESVGPYLWNSIRLGDVASPLAKGEALKPDARRRGTALQERTQNARKNELNKADMGHIGCLETERQRSSGVVNRGSPLLLAEGRGGRQNPHTSDEAP